MEYLKMIRTSLFVSSVIVYAFPVQAQLSSHVNVTFWGQIKRYDAMVSQGDVSYTREIKKRSSIQLYNYSLKYDSKSRYSEEIVLPGTGSKGGSIIRTVFDGQDSFSLNGDTVVIRSGLPFKVNPSLYWVLGMYAKPSLPMGRGLSQLKNPQVTFSGKWATVKAVLVDGTSLVAQVDMQDHFFVRKTMRYQKSGPLIGVMINSGVLLNGLIAAKSIYKYKNDIETTSFTSARFGSLAASNFRFPLRGKLNILDQRLGAGITGVKSSIGEISKVKLLEMTRASQQKMSREESRVIEAEKIQSAINVAVMMLPGLLFGSWLLLSRIKRRKRLEIANL